MNEYLTKLTELQREAAEITRHKDPDLSPEGQAKAEKRARAALKEKLEALTREFNKEAEETKRVAAAAIPGGNGDTRQHWERAKMLLEAGATLHDIVSKADAPMLHAVQEWGPTYLEADHIKTRPEGLAGLATEPLNLASLNNSLRNRWVEILDGYAPGRISRGVEAEVAEAQYQVRAHHSTKVLGGVNPGESALEIAMAAQIAGQLARAQLNAASDS